MHERRGFLGRILDPFATAIFRLVDNAAWRAPRESAPVPIPVVEEDLPPLDLDRMMWMLDEVLEQAHSMEAGSRTEPVEVRALLAAIVVECDPTRIFFERAPWPVHVLAKPPEIRRLFSILVARALADSTRTIIRLDRGTTAMVAHFDDNGPGVPRSQRDELFVFSADRHPAENALANAWQMASALGGDIRVTSSPEGGARFTVRLPTISESELLYAVAS